MGAITSRKSARQFAVALSLRCEQTASPLSCGKTAVTLVVEVPANTPFTDDVYVATDTSGWNPQAIRMQRVDGVRGQQRCS